MMFRSIILCTNLAHRRCNYTTSNIISLSKNKPGDQITINGWIKRIRDMKKYVFLDINDGSTCNNLQVVLDKEKDPKCGVGDSLSVEGILGTSPKGDLELKVENIKIYGRCKVSDGYPFVPQQSPSPEYARQYPHLRARTDISASVLRVRHYTLNEFHTFFVKHNFINVHVPIITSNDCEGAGEVFLVKPFKEDVLKSMTKPNIPLEDGFFDKKAFLTVSGQFHLEALSHGLGNVYTIGPVFRAENSKSPLHLSEFYMLEAEIAFTSKLTELTAFIEDMIKEVTTNLFTKCSPDLQNLNEILHTEIYKNPWISLTYKDAFKILEKNMAKLKTPLDSKTGFTKEQELLLVDHFSAPVFVVNWPKSMKPFYMKEVDGDRNLVCAVDLLMPRIGELVGGSLREDDFEKLQVHDQNDLSWYIDLRKYGNIPTGGFGLGFERYLQLITGIKNIRDVIPFPRWAHNCLM